MEIVRRTEGVVTGKCEYLWGCDQLLVAEDVVGEAEPKSEWYDISRLAVLERGVVAAIPYVKAPALDMAVEPQGYRGPDKPAPIR